MQTLLDKQWNKLNSNLQLFANAGADLFGLGLYYAGTGGANRGTGVGGAINTAGLAIGNFLPGPWGAVAKVGAGLAGGLINRLFGYKLNEENIQNIQDNINKGWGYNNTAQDWNSWAYLGANGPHVRMFDLNYIGRNGLLNNGATRKFNDLTAEQNASMGFKNRSDENTAKNIYASAALSANSKNYSEGGYVTPLSNPYKASSLFDYANLLYKNKFDGGGFFDNPSLWFSKKVMDTARDYIDGKGTAANNGNWAPQDTYLMSRDRQKDVFLKQGWFEGKPGDYGLVQKLGKGLPIYLAAPDAINRNLLLHLMNDTWKGSPAAMDSKPILNKMNDGNIGYAPTAFYVDPTTQQLYYKTWDVNDYGGGTGYGQYYGDIEREAADLLDKIGSPTVITSGFLNLKANNGENTTLDNFFKKSAYRYSLNPKYNPSIAKQMNHLENINGKAFLSLPEITVTPKGVTYKSGGDIHIAPNKRGTFTAAATKHGLGVLDFASQVLANKNNYSPAMVKKANFARNAAKWHAEGGHLFGDGGRPYRHGMTYDNWLTAVNEGGTHEENPNEGVLYGVDPEGTPNLVEEGEVIRNDTNYVYSNRIKPSKEFAELWGVGKNDTMADFARKIKDGMEERRFDAIALRTAKAKLDAALEELERVKMEQKGEEFRELVNQMSPEELYALQLMLQQGAMPGFEDLIQGSLAQQEVPMQGVPMLACGGKINKFDTAGQMFRYPDLRFNFTAPLFNTSYFNNKKLLNIGARPVFPQKLNLPLFSSTNLNTPVELNTPAGRAIKALLNSILNNRGDIFNTGEPKEAILPTQGMYAGVAGLGASAIASLFDSPDYTNMERVERAAAGVPYIEAPRINSTATYTPEDINYERAVAELNMAAGLRGITSNSGGNKAVANAGSIAGLKAAAESVGKIIKDGYTNNIKSYLDALKYNANIEALNAENALSAAASNLNRSAKYAEILQSIMPYRNAEKTAYLQLRNLAITGFLDSLSNIHRQNFIFNQINSNPDLAYYLINNGRANFKGL